MAIAYTVFPSINIALCGFIRYKSSKHINHKISPINSPGWSKQHEQFMASASLSTPQLSNAVFTCHCSRTVTTALQLECNPVLSGKLHSFSVGSILARGPSFTPLGPLKVVLAPALEMSAGKHPCFSPAFNPLQCWLSGLGMSTSKPLLLLPCLQPSLRAQSYSQFIPLPREGLQQAFCSPQLFPETSSRGPD